MVICLAITLEEFLEKFPYKVGDKVVAYYEGILAQFTIQNMRWNCELNKVEYKICSSWLETSVIIPYKEETMKENLTIQDIRDNNVEWLLNKLQEMSSESALQTINDLYDELHKPQYPKTYEECCKVLFHYSIELGKVLTSGYNCEKLKKFGELLICRDAYWKIAGDWKPDWRGIDTYYTISYKGLQNVKLHNDTDVYALLAFPTKEIRDAFYENFKELIEQCKELL